MKSLERLFLVVVLLIPSLTTHAALVTVNATYGDGTKLAVLYEDDDGNCINCDLVSGSISPGTNVIDAINTVPNPYMIDLSELTSPENTVQYLNVNIDPIALIMAVSADDPELDPLTLNDWLEISAGHLRVADRHCHEVVSDQCQELGARQKIKRGKFL